MKLLALVRFLLRLTALLTPLAALGWLAGLPAQALGWALLLFGGLGFLGWAEGSRYRPRTLNDRARPR